ncbi:MAG TPA: DUF5335 family protein [Solirubrobacteraceae bacterium]|nr:DUF5335 family protein [Solirubrobacteraceae bacterium]
MAPTTREIPKSDWRSYFDAFSRDLDDLLATVEVDGVEVGAQIEAERPVLRGITYDDGDDIVVIGLDASGEAGEDLERIIYSPQTIFLLTGDGGQMVFDVKDAEGTQTLVRLEPVG